MVEKFNNFVRGLESDIESRSNFTFLSAMIVAVSLGMVISGIHWLIYPVSINVNPGNQYLMTSLDHLCHVMSVPTIILFSITMIAAIMFIADLVRHCPDRSKFNDYHTLIRDGIILNLGILPIGLMKIVQTSLESYLMFTGLALWEIILFSVVFAFAATPSRSQH